MACTYFEWLIYQVTDEDHPEAENHTQLLDDLNHIDFRWTNTFDQNRVTDGMNLRNRCPYVRNRPRKPFEAPSCTVLEMMVALAVRCEEDIMSDPDEGNRTAEWFWMMVNNLGLISMTDENYDQKYVFDRVNIFLDRKYDYNGENGGLFIVKNPKVDLRTVDLWYQLCWYLDDMLNI